MDIDEINTVTHWEKSSNRGNFFWQFRNRNDDAWQAYRFRCFSHGPKSQSRTRKPATLPTIYSKVRDLPAETSNQGKYAKPNFWCRLRKPMVNDAVEHDVISCLKFFWQTARLRRIVVCPPPFIYFFAWNKLAFRGLKLFGFIEFHHLPEQRQADSGWSACSMVFICIIQCLLAHWSVH